MIDDNEFAGVTYIYIYVRSIYTAVCTPTPKLWSYWSLSCDRRLLLKIHHGNKLLLWFENITFSVVAPYHC